MKKVLIFSLAIAFISCNQTPKDYVSFSGEITNKNSDSLVIRSNTYYRTIKVNEDGSFKDTLKVETGVYNLFDGKEATKLFLKNGIDLEITIDAEKFSETVSYSGNGSETSNYIAKKILIQKSIFTPDLFDNDEAVFKSKIENLNKELTQLLESHSNIDSTILTTEKESFSKMQHDLLKIFSQQKLIANQYTDFVGKPSPKFKNYENYKGGTTSLEDLKGKYVYVDVWATWCGPCKAEIPTLKAIEKEYHNKNIEFVSISVDNGRGYANNSLEASKAGWKKMIADKQMGGTQLFADKAWQSEFIQGYQIRSIPRFILIDPNGNIVDANAPRPSNPKLKELFNSLEI